ncbi:MAG: hypothetical protein EOP87_18665 [Verrucomicrobiaceae bacterium]|nr:MAG: hypothetical protein EOP87_18665 [Verrucomicrobiaceae bacterium]
MVTRMDRTLGRMREVLGETGQADNTIIVFTSDNGATYLGGYDLGFFGGNLPLRGHKGQFWEGGIRVPCAIAWPGTIPPGKISDTVAANWDFLPTLATAAGVEVPPEIDGVNLIPSLIAGEQLPERILYWESTNGGGSQAIRSGEWKALRQGVKKDARAPIQLFRITGDIAEEHDLAPSEPELVERFSRIFVEGRTPSTRFPMGALDGK